MNSEDLLNARDVSRRDLVTAGGATAVGAALLSATGSASSALAQRGRGGEDLMFSSQLNKQLAASQALWKMQWKTSRKQGGQRSMNPGR